MINSSDRIRQKIREKQFFVNHPHYKVYSEYVTDEEQILSIETRCQIMTPEILKLKRWIPKQLHDRFFNVKIDLTMNFDTFQVKLITKSTHTNFYESNIVIQLHKDMSIAGMDVKIHINSALEMIAKPLKKRLENLVRKTIYDDYQVILQKIS